MRGKARANPDRDKVKSLLSWLNVHVCSTSSTKDYTKALPGVSALSLPQALQARATLVVNMLGARGLNVPQEVQQRLDMWVRDNNSEQINRCLCRVPFVSDAWEIIKQDG